MPAIMVFVAADGVSGFDLIVREKPDMVVADILLPRHARDRPLRKDHGPATNSSISPSS